MNNLLRWGQCQTVLRYLSHRSISLKQVVRSCLFAFVRLICDSNWSEKTFPLFITVIININIYNRLSLTVWSKFILKVITHANKRKFVRLCLFLCLFICACSIALSRSGYKWRTCEFARSLCDPLLFMAANYFFDGTGWLYPWFDIKNIPTWRKVTTIPVVLSVGRRWRWSLTIWKIHNKRLLYL